MILVIQKVITERRQCAHKISSTFIDLLICCEELLAKGDDKSTCISGNQNPENSPSTQKFACL